MEKKNSKGLVIVVVILLLAVLGLGGYLAYDKLIAKDQTIELKDQIKTLKSEIKDLNTQMNTEESSENQKQNTNYIDAVYYGYKEDSSNNNYPKEFLALFSDGTFVDLFVDADGSHGTYEINGNQLILHRGTGDGPSTGDSSYEISQDTKTITADGYNLTNYMVKE